MQKAIQGITVAHFLETYREKLQLEILVGERGLNRLIHEGSINRPALALTGFFKYFAHKRVQVLGAAEMTYLKTLTIERQAEIIRLMESCTDYSVTFARGLVLKTPAHKRAKQNGGQTPWSRAEQQKTGLLKKLQEAEQQQGRHGRPPITSPAAAPRWPTAMAAGPCTHPAENSAPSPPRIPPPAPDRSAGRPSG